MIKLTALSIVLLCTSIHSFGQKCDTILYILPDSVEILLDTKINELSDSCPQNVEFILERIDVNIYRIRLYAPKYYSERSNRYVVINTQRYPLVFDYDEQFGTTKTDYIGAIGNREGQILRSIFLAENYSITFDGSGRIINESYGIYKLKK